jgi:hypothetical protein
MSTTESSQIMLANVPSDVGFPGMSFGTVGVNEVLDNQCLATSGINDVDARKIRAGVPLRVRK